jgi:hypothetical protein
MALKSASLGMSLALVAIVSTMFLVAPVRAGGLAGCAKGSKCPVTNLSVQILDTVASIPNAIRSDGQGPYVDGVDNVKASFGDGGAFRFDTGTLLPAGRSMISEYQNPLAGSSAYTLLVQPGAHYYWQSNGVLTTTAQDLGTPGWPSSMCVDGYIKSDDAFEFYSTLYHTGIESTNSITARWLMTRVSPTTWTLETSASCGGDIVNLRHQIPGSQNRQGVYQWETIGYYHLPFKLILTKQ